MNADPLPLLPLVLSRVPDAVRRVLEQEGVPVLSGDDHPAAASAGRIMLFDSSLAGLGRIDPRQTTIDMAPLHRDEEHDPIAALASTAWTRRSWRVGHLQADEEVSRFDKRAIRRRLVGRLRRMVESAGGVWMRVAPFPDPYRSAFNFRFDHDRHLADDFQRVLDATSGHEHALSHLISGAAFEGRTDALARLRHMDVGSHGYWHHTYREADENRRNIARGIEVLQAAGIEPSGFAAPHGRWPAGLEQVLDELRISHSSEFGLAYDDLPFHPGHAHVLQIPVHPVCLGICLEAADRQVGGLAWRRRAADALAGYFEQLAADRHAAGEPMFFYGHPDGRLGQFPDVLRRLLRAVSQLPAVWQTSLTEFGHWWRARARTRTRIRVYREGDCWRVVAADRPAGYRLALECFHGDRVASLPIAGDEFRFSLAAMTFRRVQPLPAVVGGDCDRQPSLRSSVLRYFDWEKETPLEEIATHHWRGWVKHRLRQWRSRQGRGRTGSHV